MIQPTRDRQTVTPDGKSLQQRIAGVVDRRLETHADERGTLTELFRESWGVHKDPLVYAKLITIRPGRTKGWVKHLKQDDRMIVAFGTLQVVLFDDRAESPTKGMINEFCFGPYNRSLFVIPAGVYHALRNVGESDAVIINLPNNLYDHANPDKYRLPLENDLIPYTWR